MTVADETTTNARDEINLGYPRSRGAKLAMAFCLVTTLVGGLALTAGGLASLLGYWPERSSPVFMDTWILLAGIGTVALAIRCGRLCARYYGCRLIANVDGIRIDQRGRRAYRWSQIARFETDTHPKRGHAFGAVVLSDGRRIELHALLEESGIDANERPGHPVEVSDRIQTLNGLLEEARNLS